MANFTNPFLQMAADVEQRKSQAAGRFQTGMHPQLHRLIRRALRAGLPDSPLSRRIKREARRMGIEWRQLDPDDATTIAQMATRVCQDATSRLQTKPQTNDYGDTLTGAAVTATIVA